MIIRENNKLNGKPIIRVASDKYYIKKENDNILYTEIILEPDDETTIIETDILKEQELEED